MRGVGINVSTRRQFGSTESAEAGILVAAPAKEEIVVLRHAPIGSDIARIFVEGRLKRRQIREVRRIDADGRIFLGLLVITEPEQALFDGGSAEAKAILFAVEFRLGRREVRTRCIVRS